MRLSQLGEQALVSRFARRYAASRSKVLVGIGDDAAVVRGSGRKLTLLTCDMMVEGVHFVRRTSTAWQVGAKALSACLSDIAAMGGTPREALVSLALPPSSPVAWAESLADGLRAHADSYGVSVVGGDTVASPGPIVVDVFALGEVERRSVLLRSGARVGDLLLVTGTLGDAAAGMLTFRSKARRADPDCTYLVRQRHLLPRPRLHAGRLLARRRLAHAMIDISDGLASEVLHLCRRSGVGARVHADRIPVSVACSVVARAHRRDPLRLALSGGEDYELLASVPAARAARAVRILAAQTGTAPTIVGEVVPREKGVTLVLPDGSARPLSHEGFRHF